MIRGNLFHRRQTSAIIIARLLARVWIGSADPALAAGGKKHSTTATPKTPRPLRPHCGMPRPLLTAIA